MNKDEKPKAEEVGLPKCKFIFSNKSNNHQLCENYLKR